ncbi:hypothetical protein K525DRAFT_215436 [Schizophyllum commune Loenen D]|nr:hypothetical protein K525DRAFT_215436 [Schizophyllum commune Loenen D]
MPVPGFLSSIADKAQSAISAAGAHAGRPTSPEAAQTETAATGHSTGHRNFALESIHNQLRTFGQQYASTSPVQKIITVEKGIALDFESLSRDAKAQSKVLYTWGQNEDEDLKDVTDRLAYLNFIQGSLSTTLSAKLVAARAPLKALRDAETALAPKRQLRTTLENQIGRLETEKSRGYEQKLAGLREQLQRVEVESDAGEKEVELLKRKAVRESELLKWEALREYGEKLVILSQAAPRIIDALPSVPPTPNQPYTGQQITGAARAALQRALDDYKTGQVELPIHGQGDLSRHDTISFGESHASELSSIDTSNMDPHPNAQYTPPPGPPPGVAGSPPKTAAPVPIPSTKPVVDPPSPRIDTSKVHSPPLDPASLNQSPAPIPAGPARGHVPSMSSGSPPPIVSSENSQLPPVTPTVAETGMPVSAGTGGPSSGSLKDLKSPSPAVKPSIPTPVAEEAPPALGAAGHFESAEAEKRRLAEQYSQAASETPEQARKRLEHEQELARQPSTSRKPGDGDDELPPYQDM